ncbi:SGNH/GDSL hydrolase family protein [Flagellimonas myxillae]|uniref:SGNH/GDSL hydrolase family protein n=1 Tax=Flagellimonas myxillae TaxID=2942214 RepID=UPI00201FA560|nr:SGNH/GDSL hydrolase family protein [Muricauda myxillae]MCL6265557.1 SGNH/GDSL hydrolase family protein [Muricauda myxillae]
MKKILLLAFIASLFQVSAQEKANLRWWNPAENEFPVISGQAWPEEVKSQYHRLPARAEKNVRPPVWGLSKQAAGLSIRFWSNAPSIQVKYTLKGGISMPHMPATGVSGLDLYGKTEHGDWLRFWGFYALDKESTYTFTIESNSKTYNKYGREYQLFLPLYNEIENLEIGIAETSFLKPLPQRKEKPIVAYGTSICQGACASRPGMAWTNILERRLDRSIINLGFSGNGRLEPALIDLMSEIDAKLYILDCLPNLSPTRHNTYLLTWNAVKKLREKRPNTPIILTAHVGYADDFTNEENKKRYEPLNQELTKIYDQLIADGYEDIYLLTKDAIQLGFDSFVDIIHPNDFGMIQYTDAYEKLIREVLKEPVGTISTTVPTTQSRDISVYKWEDRHQEILESNVVNPPKICLFGDSIINFWGGTPASTIVNGADSWKSVMVPLGIQNFGSGWDRIENVLWRVHHDELDGFEAEKVVLMIGTNNLHLNSESEILEGLQNLIQAIQVRQPKSKLFIMGILPRTDKEEDIKKLNLKISKIADGENVHYADIGTPLLLENGALDESLFTDGLHPNSKGYALIAQEMVKVLQTD